MILQIAVLYLTQETIVSALTGHVCSRQVAETYLTSYNKAFICPERYTTACGQLDWRRCTKYRVQTCYTPTERYAVRYETVEGCCPGWKDNGNGVCSQPDCGNGCQNDGTCTDIGRVASCLCVDGFHGHRCEHAKVIFDAWRVALLSSAVATVTVMTGFCILHLRKSRKSLRSRQSNGEHEEMKTLLNSAEETSRASNTSTELKHKPETENTRPVPTAPLED